MSDIAHVLHALDINCAFVLLFFVFGVLSLRVVLVVFTQDP